MKKTLVTLLLTCAAFNSVAHSQHESPISLEHYRQYLKTLASDEFEGRAPLSKGETLTLDYLQKEFKKIGLLPGYKGSYTQAVEMAQITANQNMKLSIGDLDLKLGKDFVARTQRLTSTQLKNSELVWVGYGINAPELGWNDYQGVDVKGKTVVILVNDPGFATQDPKLFRGNTMTYYGRWTYKYEEAIRQGAAGALIVHETAPAAYPWSVVKNGAIGAKFALIDEHNNQNQLAAMGWLSLEGAQKVFAKAGLNYAEEKQKAKVRGFKPRALKLNANLKLNSYHKKGISKNVVGLIPGTEYPDEYVVISGHWDHLGKKPGMKGDNIFNGAVDNASGAAGVLELARALSKSHIKPKRSLLFVSFTAEETGLLGSMAFANQPPVPTRQMVGLLNLDGMNMNSAVDYVLSYGTGLSEMEDWLAHAAEHQHRHLKPDPLPQNGYFFRSDHFALAHKGVPGILFMSLGANDPTYIAQRYHKPDDEYNPNWSLQGIKQDLELIYDLTLDLANTRKWPNWKEGAEFKATRDADRR